MKISKRLNVIADLIEDNSKVIDCGCDHGLLSIYLAQEKNCNVLATDINENALDNAINNIRKYKVDNVTTKLTDGIENIDVINYDVLVIAGMGTMTIKHILEGKDLCDKIIISSNNQIPELRKFMISLGYYIDNETFITDKNKNYIIIKFIKGKKKYSKIDIEYGPIIKNDINYLIYELEKQFEIREKVKYSKFIVRYRVERKIKKLTKLINKRSQ